MILKKIIANNFRNYEKLELTLHEDKPFNIIHSPNGMGKSNLLEIIYYLSYLRSFRNTLDKELILKGSKSYSIEGEYKNNLTTNQIIINFNQTKEIFFNQKKVKKYSDLLGRLLTVLFCNEDILIINGAPSFRRKFFDIFISIFDKKYLFFLKNYQHILKQKNFLLKQNKNNDLIEIYNIQLAQLILYIYQKRYDTINLINQSFQTFYNEIGMFKEKVKLIFYPSIRDNKLSTESLISFFNNNLKKELVIGHSILGPHVDNFLFLINGIPFTKYASFGQTRLAVLILKLVQAEFYKNVLNTVPILLLDDVILELDKIKQAKFFDFISKYKQIFITVTNRNYTELINNKEIINEIEVEHGKIK